MRITKQGLQQLIDEEYSRAIARRSKAINERLHPSGELYELDATDLIGFAKAYAGLGNAVQEQLDDILDEAENDDVNPNAVDLMQRELGGFNEEIDETIAIYKEWRTGAPAGMSDDDDQMDEQDDGMDQDTGMTIHGPVK